MRFFRRAPPATKRLKQNVRAFFKQQNAVGIGMHGTLSEKLDTIRKQGLRTHGMPPISYYAGRKKAGDLTILDFDYYAIREKDVLKILKKKGKTWLLRQFIEVIRRNMGWAQTHAPENGMRIQDYGIVIGRVTKKSPKYPSEGFGVRPPLFHIGIGGFPKEDILLTVHLTKNEEAALFERFPKFSNNGIPFDPKNKDAQAIKHEIAKVLASKIIRSLLTEQMEKKQ